MKPLCSDPAVELIIPVYKPGKELERLLQGICGQTYLPHRIQLLITASADDFERIAGTYAGMCGAIVTECVHVLPTEFDHGGTRHRGAAQSQADILLFMTQDAVPDNDHLVEEMVKAMLKTVDGEVGEGEAEPLQTGAVYARQLPAVDCNVIERYTRQFNYPDQSRIKTEKDLPTLGIKTYFCSNVCAAYRRDIYEELGGFERRTIFNEDMIFAAGLIRAGYAIAYVAEARVIHSHNYSGLQQLHRNFDLAVSQAEYPEIFEAVPSEGEGIRMVKSTVAYLCKHGKAWLVPQLVWQSGCKYLGYLLGKRYRKLPQKMVMWLTMNKRYWKE